jgi:hypothetical protein
MFVGLLSVFVQLNSLKAELIVVQSELAELRSIKKFDTAKELGHPERDQRLSVVKRSVEERVRRRRRRGEGDGGSRRNYIAAVTSEQVENMISRALKPFLHPSAHMALLVNDDRNISEDLPPTNEPFRWTAHRSNASHNTVFEFDGDYSRLVVQSSGTYYIYVQVMYNGRTSSRRKHPTCSHTVKLITSPDGDSSGTGPSTSRVSVVDLLYASTTQVQLGGPIHVLSDGRQVAAYDSTFAAGIFHLEENDILIVQPDDFSQYCRVIPHTDCTFLGAHRLQSPIH